ncbi:MAG TPA: hypothetical protein IAB17_06120 [Candidatus Alectryocaccobium stercorigallinarum]|nr:hypothetical protein [Candidatus Alectryocaccobium stercorigallinarum]
MESTILYAIFILGGLLVLCMVANIILTAKKGAPNKWLTRILYLSGIACVILSIVRIAMKYSENSTMLIIACVIVLASILISFWRSEHPVNSDES